MMKSGLFMLMFTSGVSAAPADDLKRDMKALELFLQDQEEIFEFIVPQIGVDL